MVVPPHPPVEHPHPIDPDQVPAARARRIANTYVDAADQWLKTNAAYLATGNPTPPQTEAQVATLTRQMNGVIQLLLFRDRLSDDADAGLPEVTPTDG